MIVNADELKLFRTIYETESLSEAAARLQLSLPKASRQLASLRKTFGDKLFVRCDHRMCPTLRARSLLPKVDALLSGFEALEDPGVFSVEQLRHVFRIAGLDNALLSYFGPVLGALGRHAPGVRLNFHSISSNFYAELHQGRIDLAIYATQESFPTFRRLAICEDAYVYVARGTSELARRVLSGQVLTEREVRARQSVQIALPKASADDCGLIPVIESLDAFACSLGPLLRHGAPPPRRGGHDLHSVSDRARALPHDGPLHSRTLQEELGLHALVHLVGPCRRRSCAPVAEELSLLRNEAAPRRSARRADSPKLMFSDSSLEFPSPAGFCRNLKSAFAD